MKTTLAENATDSMFLYCTFRRAETGIDVCTIPINIHNHKQLNCK